MRIRRSPQKKSLIIMIALIIGVSLLSGSVYAYTHLVKQSADVQLSEDSIHTKNPDRQVLGNKDTVHDTKAQTSTESSVVDEARPTNKTSSNKATNSTSPSYIDQATDSNDIHQEIVVTCNETMKASYTNLYESMVAAENARWTQQVNGFHTEASRRGMSFSGYAQEQIDLAKPAHEATLANIQNDYAINLHSINCL